MMVTSRRSVLRMSLGLGAAAMMPPLATRAFGQSTDYRALVCLYLDGGLDSDDVLIPYDQPSYDAYAASSLALGALTKPFTSAALIEAVDAALAAARGEAVGETDIAWFTDERSA